MYELRKDLSGNINCVYNKTTDTIIPFASANTDYANFKAQINADEAQLQDADGNLMTAEQAKEFVSTLP